ncbi:MAG: DUF6624 domain-containing protein [Psychroflexus sp.]
MKKIFLILILIISQSCKKSIDKKSVDVEYEIENLKTTTDKNNYLEYIYDLDQKIRNGESSELLVNFGESSIQYQNFLFKMDSIDNLNYERIDLFLMNFNYPNKDSVSKKAVSSPWLVIHHNSDNKKRKKHFKKLLQAYENENIDVDQFDLYLRRTYRIEFGENLSWEGAYNPDDKIDWMIKEMNFE